MMVFICFVCSIAVGIIYICVRRFKYVFILIKAGVFIINQISFIGR